MGFLTACSGKGGVEILQHTHDVLAVAWAPSGKLLASATLDGQIYFWDPLEAQLQARAPMGSFKMLSLSCILLLCEVHPSGMDNKNGHFPVLSQTPSLRVVKFGD